MLAWAKRTFLRKLSVSMAVLILVSTGLVGIIASRIARKHLTDEVAAKLTSQGRLIIPRLPVDDLARADADKLDAWADRFGPLAGARVTLVTKDGAVVGDSEVAAEALRGLDDHGDRPEILRAMEAGHGSSVRRSGTLGVDFLYVALPVEKDGRVLGVLRLAMPLSSVRESVSRLRAAIAVASMLCLAGGLVLSLYVSRSIHRPIARLSETADKIAQGDFRARAEVSSPDEIGRLSEIISSLASRVSRMIGELSAEKTQLEAILDNMVEGVALVDASGRLQELNPVMERFLGLRTSEARGTSYAKAMRQPALQELLGNALRDRAPQVREVTLAVPDEKIFEGHANPMLDGETLRGAVVVLHDITRLRRLEEVRKEFVANVSHELRTPLASIKGFAETLRRGGLEDEEHRLEFVRTIEDRANQLSRLVDDLLELAAIESDKRELVSEVLELDCEVGRILDELEHLAAKGSISLRKGLPPGLKVRADREGLRQVLRNLVENGIKYNRKGGSVEVGAMSRDGFVEVSVRDTGIGVPEGDLPRLFERFYRVDKARSRALGGTGLGLSIVKHIVETLGGEVRAESADGEGTSFFFTLPAA